MKSAFRFSRLLAAFAALVLALCAAPAAWAQAAPKAKVVFQVSDADPAKWNLTLNNVKNVQADLGAANVEIEVVAYGPGIGILKAESVAGNRVRDAIGSGVAVMACENTMQNQKLAKDDMLPGIGYVPAGVVELIKRQQQGWAYIRP